MSAEPTNDLSLYLVEIWHVETEDCVYALVLANSKAQAAELATKELPVWLEEEWEDATGMKCELLVRETGAPRVLWSMMTYGG